MNTFGNTKMADVIAVQSLYVSAYTIPAWTPEEDGTIKWNSSTLVLVELKVADKIGIGYTYASPAAALINDVLKKIIINTKALNVPSSVQLILFAVYAADESPVK